MAPPRSTPPTLIDELLAEQHALTAVEQFARAHDAHEVRTQRYRELLPTSLPVSGQQYAFEVNLDQCSGCKACVTACHSLNGLDEAETWRSVGQLVSTEWRNPLTQTVTTACHHCIDPGCLNGCPVLAYDKDPVTGIVKHLDDQCIGCQYCVMKCPYEVPQYLPNRGIVRKCDMCSSRLAVGEAPACVQACPNEAIKITLVELARVRGKYRPLISSKLLSAREKVGKWVSGKSAARDIAHSPTYPPTHSPANAFLPDSPNPAITIPTTRYVTTRALPADLEAGDAHEVHPAKAHLPLTILLVLSQLGVGLTLMNALNGGRSRNSALAALVVTVIAVNVGALHLGQPLKAWRGFLGWRTSWFSRELIAFGVFIGALAAHVAILHPLSSILAAVAGLSAVACSAMIYVDTRRPFWNAPMTFGKFFGTTLMLGALASTSAPLAFAVLLVGVIVKLAAENRIFRFLVDPQDPQLTALNKTALLLTGRFGLMARGRIACLLTGGMLVLLLALHQPAVASQPALASGALAFCLAGELIERHLFFVAEVAPKMPGGGTA